ncbi:hypothetical protein [Nocardioides gilvus]|uniref:hypothetical protein n=1 Tax=Nocardioides gilvus TaxID=1735589 RepID=UPI0013A53AEE|nr:hypothetical protein [Nocardioides gilvus]
MTEKISTWWGSTADAEAGQVLASYSLNGITDSCLEQRGYPRFDWRASIFPVSSSQEFAVGGVLGVFDSMLFADDYARSLETDDIETFLNSPPERSEKEIAAEDACLKESRKSDVSDDELDAMKLPPAVAELRGLWQETVTDAESRVVKADEFKSCFDEEKLPEMRGRSGDELAHLADEVKREIEAEKLSPKETVAKFGEWDSAITGAFRECAEPYLAEVQNAIDAAHQQFERDHATQIKQAQDAWASVRRDAEKLGWSPDEPLAGYERQHVG